MPSVDERVTERQRRRQDPKQAADTMAQLLPDAGLRHAILGILGESIAQAHELNPGAWEVTVDFSRPFVRHNVGGIFVLDIQPHGIQVTLKKSELPATTRRRLRDLQKGGGRFNVQPDLHHLELDPRDLVEIWPELLPGHRAAIEMAAAGYQRSPFYRAHSPGAVDLAAAALGLQLPRPSYATTEDRQIGVPDLVSLVQKRYPEWAGFDDARFVSDERDYKQKTVEKARQSISKEHLSTLLAAGKFEELVRRLDLIGKDNNLLYRGVPKAGDLGILYQDNLDKPAFSKTVFDLLYGEGDAPERLGRYLSWVDAQGLPSKWTFPTYFLWVCHPEDEVFVKPTVAQATVRLLGSDLDLQTPNAEAYAEYRQLIHEVKGALAAYRPKDVTDVQGFLYTAVKQPSASLIDTSRRTLLEGLWAEFLSGYVATDRGTRHKALYTSAREEGRRSFEAITESASRGQDVTSQVLLKLLPHTDYAGNRERGAWVHWAPAINGDIRSWFEDGGLAKPEDWPATATAILHLAQRATEDPHQIRAAVERFSAECPSKGFQCGLLTPILNATRPEAFLVLNQKSRRLISYLSDRDVKQTLDDYPETNALGLELVEELQPLFSQEGVADMGPGDAFDMFSHWLVAEKRFDFGKRRYWKIAPEEGGRLWERWREKGIASIGWEELGDISSLSRKEFDDRLKQLLPKHPNWKGPGARQVWRFAQIEIGDRVVANAGTSKVLGAGTVTGAYHFVPGEEHGHRLGVEWDDTVERDVTEPGWKRTLIELDEEVYKRVTARDGGDGPQPGTRAFTPAAFDLLAQLKATPTREFYLAHKEGFVREVERPFQALFRDVVSRMPQAITEAMETQRDLFGRILKNDWGRGGAWDFYWGALYPKDGRRVEDAQLFVWIHEDRLEFGFFIGEHGGEKVDTFKANAQRHLPLLARALEGYSGPPLEFGNRDSEGGAKLLQWREWLASLSTQAVYSRARLSREEVLRTSRDDLLEMIKNVFLGLFPLVYFMNPEFPANLVRQYLGEDTVPPGGPLQPSYPVATMAADCSFDEAQLTLWVRAIERKGQAILYGPPGTGKTFIAKALAKHVVGGGDGFVELVQFHPSYAYEDFMLGIRPKTVSGGLTYENAKGRFLEFCERARERSGKCVLIVDEINRANLSRVFGELMYLLEYREGEVPLAGGVRFQIPHNVRLIGTMNTADRSIALVDHALRRRFAFLRLQPNYDVLHRFHERHATGFPVEKLVKELKDLNTAINNGHYEVGISFFLSPKLADHFEDVWRMEVEPYLEEYFFDQDSRVNEFRWDKVRGRLGLGG